jgi:hypothetical protein
MRRWEDCLGICARIITGLGVEGGQLDESVK